MTQANATSASLGRAPAATRTGLNSAADSTKGNPMLSQTDLGPGAQPFPPGQDPHVTSEMLGGIWPADADPGVVAAAQARVDETVA